MLVSVMLVVFWGVSRVCPSFGLFTYVNFTVLFCPSAKNKVSRCCLLFFFFYFEFLENNKFSLTL